MTTNGNTSGLQLPTHVLRWTTYLFFDLELEWNNLVKWKKLIVLRIILDDSHTTPTSRSGLVGGWVNFIQWAILFKALCSCILPFRGRTLLVNSLNMGTANLTDDAALVQEALDQNRIELKGTQKTNATTTVSQICSACRRSSRVVERTSKRLKIL